MVYSGVSRDKIFVSRGSGGVSPEELSTFFIMATAILMYYVQHLSNDIVIVPTGTVLLDIRCFFFFCLYKIKYWNKIIKEIEKRNKTQTNRYKLKESSKCILKRNRSKFLNEAISTEKNSESRPFN